MTDEQIIDPASIDPPGAPAIEPAAVEPAADPPAHGNAGKTPWYMQRISEESARAREATERVAAAERRAMEAEALAQRLQATAGGQQAPPAAPAAPAPQTDMARQAEINAAATAQRFFEDTLEVRNRGIAKFGQAFGETLNVLGALGATTNDFIADVLAIDKANAHELLVKIAKDPEKATALTQMNSRQRIAELTRMQMAEAKAIETPAIAAVPSKGVSKAPAPPPPIEPSNKQTKDWRQDDSSEEEFNAGFKEMQAKRNTRR